MTQHFGILTSGGDCPGLNAAIRGIVKAGHTLGMRFTGFRDGFRGLVHDRTMVLTDTALSGILTDGGTILGTSRDKPHRMEIGGKVQDMTGAIIETYRRHHLEALICLGGGGTQKNALRLQKAGLNVVTLPKTIDNDVAETDKTFGFDTALDIATEAIDRLHSTATSHRRIIVVEIMGHRVGWLALGAGLAGGADVILLPEIPYDLKKVAAAIKARTLAGKRFSIVAVAEGAMSSTDARKMEELARKKAEATTKKDIRKYSERLEAMHEAHVEHTVRLTRQLEQQVGQEARLTILGHLQRGGTPSAADRVLATKLGTACARVLAERRYGVMIAARNGGVEAVPLEQTAGKLKFVPKDHPWVQAARLVGTSFGDE
ncbi:MAG: ATP-dependent phosphofructokinase / diphosphate-dependent phosphofructokinase [Candidatus Sumerlaeota bacterium]|nr:ATP-dependent phosphofructokinase / diphosphate-dependent phosphofructokinase [Candidatus Sumerlaeota bacterium]